MTKPKKILALDLGSSAFKMVLLEVRDSKVILSQARLLEIPAQSEPKVRQAALKALLERIDLARLSQVVSVLDDPFTCIRPISVPPMPRSEMADAVKWELQRFLAVPPEEVSVDFKQVGSEETGGVKKQRLLAVALPAASIREHLSFLAQAGVRPTHLIPKAGALSAWLSRGSHGPAAMLEVGGSACEFLVLEKGEAVFARKIPGGGAILTREMTGLLMTEQGQVSLTEGEAETVKRSIGIPQADAAGMGVQGVSGMQILSLIRGSLERLAVETERSLAFYGESGGREAVNEILLVGGGAQLKGLPDWLQGRLGLRVTVPKIFEGVQVAPGALQSAAVSSELGFAAALGAALGADKGMNLLPSELQESLRVGIQRAALKAAVTGGILSAALLWSGMQVYRQSLSKQISALELEQGVVAQQMPFLQAAAAAQKSWEAEPDWEEIFRNLSHQVPPEIYLTELVMDGRRITLRGRIRKQAGSADKSLTRFLQTLGTGEIKEIALRSSRQLEQSSDQAEFEIGGVLS